MMHKLIPTLALAGTLTLAMLSEATPHKAQDALPHLTATEEICLRLGNIAHTSATMRDKGLSYLDALQRLRKVITTTTTPGPWIDWFHTMALRNLRFVYDNTFMTPVVIRRETELICLAVLEPVDNHVPILAKDHN